MNIFRRCVFPSIFLLILTAQPLAAQPIIADHNCTDITAIPEYWINQAKATLHIAYGHTSHGSQLTTGMTGLVGFANGGGKELSLPDNIFAWNNGGTGGALDLHDYAMGGDVGYYPQWVNNTTEYLGPVNGDGRGSNNPDVNVIVWSWCGQASSRTEETMNSTYLDPMTALETTYYDVTFVYMTGHADGSGLSGNLHLRNQQIRNYCVANNKVLYDFYDIECYDPDGNYYGDKLVNDNCDYDSDGNGTRDSNWATAWQSSHTEGVDWYDVYAAHSQALNGNQKAYAAWWLWAVLAGWDESLPVQMADLRASARPDGGIEIRWRTACEVNCIGFRVLRSEAGTDAVRDLTPSLIPGRGNSSCGSEYRYMDSNVRPDVIYTYQVEALFTDGQTDTFGPIQAESPARADRFILHPNYPNPFNSDTWIAYEIPESGPVKLVIYDVTGRKIRTLSEGYQQAGLHELRWDGRDSAGRTAPSGIYVSRLTAESFTLQRKMMLLK